MAFTRETNLITVVDAAKIYPASPAHIREKIKAGEMRGAKYGNRWMTTEEWVCECIEEMSYEARKAQKEQ